jgi:hypothetical protein
VPGFWKAPKALVHLLAERELTVSAYTLLHFVAESGADRPDGYTTTNEYLAVALEMSDKTVRRALVALREQGLVDYRDHERIPLFTIRTGETLRSLLRSPETPVVTAQMTAQVTADPAATPATPTTREPAPTKAQPAVTLAVPTRARAKTENKNEKETTSTSSSYVLGNTAPASTKSQTLAQEQEQRQERTKRRPPRRSSPSEPERLGNIDPLDCIDPDREP